MANEPVFLDLPLGMRTWIYANASDVVAAMYCLMKNPDIFRMCLTEGMLENLADQTVRKAS